MHSARRPYAGVCFPRGGGVRSGGVPGPGGGVSGPGGCLVQGGVSGLGGRCVWSGGVGLSALWDTTPPPVNRMTDRCKNITLATTSLRPVTIYICYLPRVAFQKAHTRVANNFPFELTLTIAVLFCFTEQISTQQALLHIYAINGLTLPRDYTK